MIYLLLLLNGVDFTIQSIYQALIALVTQPMLQRRPNRTELSSMESFIKFYVDSKNVSFLFCQGFIKITFQN